MKIDLLTLHRNLVEIPSVSHEEEAIVAWLANYFESHGVSPYRIGDNLVLEVGKGPTLCLNSHLDTVPASDGWMREPWIAQQENGRVYGLGSNDAKASVAAMIATYLKLHSRVRDLGIRLMLALVVEEETGGDGSELVVRELSRLERLPDAVVIGEPTGLDVAIAQKGLMVVELVTEGTACHAAHAQARGAVNPIRMLGRDLCRLEDVDLGSPDPLLGPVTVEPTVLSGGKARNAVPRQAACVFDVRTNPTPCPADIVERLQAVVEGTLHVRSDRLRPCATPCDHVLMACAKDANPDCQFIGSRTLSDWVYFADLAAIKVGPGATERSHTEDEFVLEQEVIAGASFYESLVMAFASRWRTD